MFSACFVPKGPPPGRSTTPPPRPTPRPSTKPTKSEDVVEAPPARNSTTDMALVKSNPVFSNASQDKEKGGTRLPKSLPAAAFEPAQAFARQLCKKTKYRKKLTELLREECLASDGNEVISAWLREEGFETDVKAISMALDDMTSNNLMFFASRYHLFVSWSPDRQHPWDMAQAASHYVLLEIGADRSADGQLLVLLNGRPVSNYTFRNCLFKTTAPVEWEAPDGTMARVSLELQMSAFFGYGGREAPPDAYLGLQCHGVLWPAEHAARPVDWPVSPPIVSGKVNVMGREAAMSPGSSDALAAFVGHYATHILPETPGELAAPGPNIAIADAGADQPVVMLGGRTLAKWAFNANVLSWEEAGKDEAAWLQFIVLPGGPVFVGRLPGGDVNAAKGRAFGELVSQPSRLAPDGALDLTMGQVVAAGLAATATMLIASLLRTTLKCWGLLRGGVAAEDLLGREQAMLVAMRREYEVLGRVHAALAATAAVFPGGAGCRELQPGAAADALAAEAEAAEHAQVARVCCEAVDGAAAAAEAAAQRADPADATSKAALAAWRAAQAAQASSKAEDAALQAAKHAALAHTSSALAASLAAAQAFNQARDLAVLAARGEVAGARFALAAVEDGIKLYAERREYLKLKDIAEASDVAGKALVAAEDALAAWGAGTAEARHRAVQAANTAAEASQLAHKFTRMVAAKK